MNREEKDQMIAALDGMLNDNSNFYLADISGTNISGQIQLI